MAGDTRKQRVVLETSRHTISGEVILPLEGLRTRLSDLLNAEGLSFVSIIDAEITPLEGGDTVRREFVAVALEHVQIAYESE